MDEQNVQTTLFFNSIKRRSFLKLVATGLVAAFPAAAGLLKVTPVYAHVPCMGTWRCATNYWLWVRDGCVWGCQDTICWDERTLDLCWHPPVNYTRLN